MTDERKRIVDRLGVLEDEIAPHKPAIKEAEALRKTVRGWTDDDEVDPLANVVYDGSKYQSFVKAAESRRRITSLPKLFRLLKQRKFLALCSFTLKALDDEVTVPLPKGLVVLEPTGPREVLTVKKAA